MKMYSAWVGNWDNHKGDFNKTVLPDRSPTALEECKAIRTMLFDLAAKREVEKVDEDIPF